MKNVYLPLAFLLSAGAWGTGCYNISSISTPGDGGASSSGGGGGSSSGSGSSGGGSSGGSSSGASTGPFCASQSPQPDFCDDFDEEDGGLFAKWDVPNNSSPYGSISLSQTQAKSPPNSMLAQTGAIAAGAGNIELDLEKDFPDFQGTAISISLQFAMNVQQVDSMTGQIIAAEVIFDGANSFNQIAINLDSLNGAGVTGQIAENAEFPAGTDAGLSYFVDKFTAHPVIKQWTQVELDLTVPTPNGSNANLVSVKLDGTTVVDSKPLMVPLQGGLPTVRVGIGSVTTTNPETAWDVFYDNVIINVQKI